MTWPLIQIVHEVLAKPFMFDARTITWNGIGHWPLMVNVGDKRRRSGIATEDRVEVWQERQREKRKAAEEGRKMSPSRGGKRQRKRESSRDRVSERPDARVIGARSSGIAEADISGGVGSTTATSSGTLSK